MGIHGIFRICLRGAVLSCALVSTDAFAQMPARAPDVISFQPYRQDSREVALSSGGSAQLIDLNTQVGAWFLLRINAPGAPTGWINLERAALLGGRGVRVSLSPAGLVISGGPGAGVCPIGAGSAFANAAQNGAAFASVCGGALYIRRRPGQAGIANLAAGAQEAVASIAAAKRQGSSGGPPPRARIDARHASSRAPAGLGIEIDAPASGALAGEWYPARNARPGIYASSMQPNQIESALLATYASEVEPLTGQQGATPFYLVAFDLSRFTVGWSKGSERPHAGWSESASHGNTFRAQGIHGPDGFGNFAPLAETGLLNSAYLPRLAATMCGGFQRRHGMFHNPPFSTRDRQGYYWGFMENGVVYSRLQTDLASLAVDVNGDVTIKKWTDADNARLGQYLHVRQNGVPVVDGIDARGDSIPGPFMRVNNRFSGAWSGALAENGFYTQRAAACMYEESGRKFLIYAYSPSTIPGTIARVFQSLRCRGGIHLDMNNPEWSYLGVVGESGGRLRTENPGAGMSGANRSVQTPQGASTLPKFTTGSDVADFFYFVSKDGR